MIARTPKDLGHLIRDQRRRRRLTQAALAQLVGASRKWIVDLEGGKRTAELSLVLRTIRALGLEVDVRDAAAPHDDAGIDLDRIVDRSKHSTRTSR